MRALRAVEPAQLRVSVSSGPASKQTDVRRHRSTRLSSSFHHLAPSTRRHSPSGRRIGHPTRPLGTLDKPPTMAPTLLLLALAHTLVLSLLPLVVLHLPRLARSASPIQSTIIGTSTLCVGLFGTCALVALAGSGVEDGRVASLVAGTLACVGSLFSTSLRPPSPPLSSLETARVQKAGRLRGGRDEAPALGESAEAERVSISLIRSTH